VSILVAVVVAIVAAVAAPEPRHQPYRGLFQFTHKAITAGMFRNHGWAK